MATSVNRRENGPVGSHLVAGRFSKEAVHQQVVNAGEQLIGFMKGDRRLSKGNLSEGLQTVDSFIERDLLRTLASHMDHRDHESGSVLTETEIREEMVPRFYRDNVVRWDEENNGLSRANRENMSKSARLLTALAVAANDVDARPFLRQHSSSYDLLQAMPGWRQSSDRYTRAADVPVELREMMVRAVRASTFDDGVKGFDLQKAFESVDQGEIVVRNLTDRATGSKIIMIDYGAGDNTYGSIFDRKGFLLADINDGDLYHDQTPAAP